MEKISAWLFLLIGILWLLPLLGVGTGSWGGWLATLALLVIGIAEVMKSKKK